MELQETGKKNAARHNLGQNTMQSKQAESCRVEQYEKAVPCLLDWYDYHARILPWREEPTPYQVWVSEIMLQQTRVEAVRIYYHRFLQELPDIRALAQVSEDRLLKLWEGLGYYSRVRNLQKAARLVCEAYDGELPSEYETLQKLPGIGSYTAGAIASIAYHQPVPAVDGNVLRVMSRLTGSREDIADAAVKRQMFRELLPVMPGERSGDLNQAVMDIGAGICIPNGKPHCEECPLMHLCAAYREEMTDEIPVKARKKERKLVKRTVFLIHCADGMLLRKRSEKGLLAGMWEYPGAEEWLLTQEALQWVCEQTGCSRSHILQMKPLKEAVHIFTHVEWHMKAYEVQLSCKGMELPAVAAGGMVCADREERNHRYSLPTAVRKWERNETCTK